MKKRSFQNIMSALLVTVVSSAPICLGSEKEPPIADAESEIFGKLEYVDHLTRKDLICVTSIETSPDGKFAYAAAYNSSALIVFERDKETGYLKHVQTISNREDFDGAVCARVSPDGGYVVCTAFRSNTVSLFERDRSKGTLKRLDIVRQGERGGQGLTWVIDSAFSPDSQFVYTIADLGRGQKGALSVFRITDERKLQLVQEFVQTHAGENKYLLGARGIAVSPKGDSVYVVSNHASTLVVLDRDAKSGKTEIRQIIEDEKGDVHGLGGAFAVTCSADDKFVYTSAPRWEGDNAICVFKKTADGTLSLVQEIFDGKDGVTGFVGGNELRVSPDGRNVYALGSQSNSVVVFRRNVESGELAYLQTLYNSDVASKIGTASGIGISPDGEYVYVAGEFDCSVLMFKRSTGTKKEPSEALHRAAFFGDIDQVKSLIADNADLNKNTERGYAPLHWAVKAGQEDIAELLIANSADINARTGSGGWTPLHIAVMQSNKDMAAWLISRGADVHAVNQNNEFTPLLIAVMGGKTDLAELLISNGTEVDVQNDAGYTALFLAIIQGNKDMAELLIAKGADVNIRNVYGQSLLHWSVSNGQRDIAELLIIKGADVNAKVNGNWTPLRIAVDLGHKEIIELLRKHGAKE